MNKKEIDRVIKDMDFLNNQLKKLKESNNYKPQYPCHLEEEEEDVEEED